MVEIHPSIPAFLKMLYSQVPYFRAIAAKQGVWMFSNVDVMWILIDFDLMLITHDSEDRKPCQTVACACHSTPVVKQTGDKAAFVKATHP